MSPGGFPHPISVGSGVDLKTEGTRFQGKSKNHTGNLRHKQSKILVLPENMEALGLCLSSLASHVGSFLASVDLKPTNFHSHIHSHPVALPSKTESVHSLKWVGKRRQLMKTFLSKVYCLDLKSLQEDGQSGCLYNRKSMEQRATLKEMLRVSYIILDIVHVHVSRGSHIAT